MNVQVNKDVSWVGVLDKDIVTFDIVMETQYGTTYNSYFINADKKAIVDTTKETFKDEYLDKIKELTNPEEIEVIVISHTEPDHSGNLKNLLEVAPNAVVYGSRQAVTFLKDILNIDFKSEIVKDGDSISLGNKTLKVIGAPNLHWPDTIFTYLEEDKLLFTCDSFGAHYCSDKIFDDEVGDYSDAFKYYFDVILKPFSNFMLKAIDKIESLDIATICPGHGPILRSTWKEKVELSKSESQQYVDSISSQKRILITYVSAYGYTKQMAGLIAKGIQSIGDYIIDFVDLEELNPAELEGYIINSKGMLIGSPTINKNTLINIYQLFAFINPLRDRGKKVAVFGSYGWSGEAIALIENILKQLNLDVAVDGLKMKFHPGADKEQTLIDFGKAFATEIQG